MRKYYCETIDIPEGISCDIVEKTIFCKKDSTILSRFISDTEVIVTIKNNQILLECKKGNRHHQSVIKSLKAHLANLFTGLENKFVYALEACNVHFPMTLKVEGDKLIINNFLGERVSRKAKIVPGVNIETKGQKITISSYDKEAAGQTAANIEKATRVRNRDRRVFQDGIYIVSKPKRKE